MASLFFLTQQSFAQVTRNTGAIAVSEIHVPHITCKSSSSRCKKHSLSLFHVHYKQSPSGPYLSAITSIELLWLNMVSCQMVLLILTGILATLVPITVTPMQYVVRELEIVSSANVRLASVEMETFVMVSENFHYKMTANVEFVLLGTC